jgi:HSP20 family protein
MQAPIVNTLRKEMDRFLDRFSEGDLQPVLGRWVPPVDVFETDESLMVELEIPGFDPTDVHVTLKDQVLTVRGELKKEDPKDWRIVRHECAHASFVRMIPLPAPADAARGTAVFHNGLLTITVNKADEARGTSIPVSSA